MMKGRILLVEADVVLGAVLSEVLRHSGYEVFFVRTLQGKVEGFGSLRAVLTSIGKLRGLGKQCREIRHMLLRDGHLGGQS